MIPADPAARLSLDPDVLALFPEGYRYLGYLQHQTGLNVSRTLHNSSGAEMAALREARRRWMAGEAPRP